MSGGKRHPELLPARAGPVRTDPDSADRRSASCACLARGQSGARTAPAPTCARARTQMRAIKGRSKAGPERRMNTSRTKEPPPHVLSRPSLPPPAGKPSASTTMTKHELTCHSMTHRNSPPLQPASSRTARSSVPRRACGPTPIQSTGAVRPASASRAGNQAREPRRRRHAPAPAQGTRELGSRRSGQPGGGTNGMGWNETG